MTRRKQTKGKCAFCGRAMTRNGMARHLTTCEAREKQIAEANPRPKASKTHFRLQVQDAYAGDYWLQLEMAGAAPLRHLDAYLRAIWLECCGHLSRFTIGHAWRGREIPITAKAGQVLRPGAELTHIYDFGTSSETRIRVIGERQGAATSARPIMLMARNDAPELSCMECDRSATALCMECVYEYDRNGMLCEEHAAEHPHEDYGGPLPVVNSPRMGMCGYDGPAEAPY